jgi:hypothetical protein
MKKKILEVVLSIFLISTLFVLTGCENNSQESKDDESSKISLSSQVKVGDYVAYNAGTGNSYTSPKEKNGIKTQTFQTTGTEKWRVLSIDDDGTVNLISENGIRTTDDSAYELIKAKGCANAIDELNNICAIFGKGKNAISARSMDYKDAIKIIGIEHFEEYYDTDLSSYNTEDEKVEKILELLAKENKMTANNANYGKDFEVTKNTYVPDSTSEDGFSQAETLNSTDSYIFITHIETDLTSNKDTISLFAGKESGKVCWLATPYKRLHHSSRAKDSSEDYVEYGVYATYADLNILRNSSIDPVALYASDNTSDSYHNSCYVRPIVSLDKNTKVTSGDGSSTEPYEID